MRKYAENNKKKNYQNCSTNTCSHIKMAVECDFMISLHPLHLCAWLLLYFSMRYCSSDFQSSITLVFQSLKSAF